MGRITTKNMSGDGDEMKALMGQFFDVIDIDGSGSIEEKEIKCAVMAMFAAIGDAKTEEEKGLIMTGAGFFLVGIGQLGESLGEDSTACSREQWDAFEMQPIEGVSEEDMMGGLLCFLGLVAMAVEGKEEVQAALRELAASPDFDAKVAEFEEKLGK